METSTRQRRNSWCRCLLVSFWSVPTTQTTTWTYLYWTESAVSVWWFPSWPLPIDWEWRCTSPRASEDLSTVCFTVLLCGGLSNTSIYIWRGYRLMIRDYTLIYIKERECRYCRDNYRIQWIICKTYRRCHVRAFWISVTVQLIGSTQKLIQINRRSVSGPTNSAWFNQPSQQYRHGYYV